MNTSVTGLTLRSGLERVSLPSSTRTFAGVQHSVKGRRGSCSPPAVSRTPGCFARFGFGRDGAALGNEARRRRPAYFSEHIHAPVATFVPTQALQRWSSYDLTTWPRLSNSVTLTPEAQAEAHLLNASLAVGPSWYVGVPPFVRRDYRIKLLVVRAVRL